MSSVGLYSMTTEELTQQANNVKDALLVALEAEGKLKESAETLGANYIVCAVKPSWLGRFIAKLAGENSGQLKYVVSRVI